MSSRSSRTSASRSLPETVDVARIRRAHGVRGAVLVETISDVVDRFRCGASLWLRGAGGERQKLTIRSSSAHPRGRILGFEELQTREQAAALAGAALEVGRQDVPPAPNDRWYHFELIGCRCQDRRAGDLGTVQDVVEDGGGVLLRVADGRREVLIPFVLALVPSVDVAAGRIELDLPDGFLDTCTSPS